MADVYDDSENFGFSTEVQKLREENKTLLYRIFILENDNKCLSETLASSIHTSYVKFLQKYALSETKIKQLSTNISSLHKTSIIEVRRKDRIIQELREKIEFLISKHDRSVESRNAIEEQHPPANHRESHLPDTISYSSSNRPVYRDRYTSKQRLYIRDLSKERYLPEKALVKLDKSATWSNSYKKTHDSEDENMSQLKKNENKSFLPTSSRQCLSPRNSKLNLERDDSLRQIYNTARSRSRSCERFQNFHKKRSVSPYWNTESKSRRDRSNSGDKIRYYNSKYRFEKYASRRHDEHGREDRNRHSPQKLEWLLSENNYKCVKIPVEHCSESKTTMGGRILTDKDKYR